MVGLSVADRLKSLKNRISQACQAGSRDVKSVHLLAVSKLQSVEKIREAFACGQVDFAENYFQEAEEKQSALSDLAIRWHFIGRIQSNKAKFLPGKFYAIHSVDKISLLEPLNAVCVKQNIVQNIFLQFNVASESTKGGASKNEMRELLEAARKCKGLKVLGLMVMPPLLEDSELARPYFVEARELCKELGLSELSMGTSGDYPVAIAEGATWVRIGSEVFGERK